MIAEKGIEILCADMEDHLALIYNLLIQLTVIMANGAAVAVGRWMR